MSINPLNFLARYLRYIHALAGGAMFILIVVILLNAYVVTYFQVDGMSMSPTLHSGQLVGVNLLAYSTQKPKIGDVVIIQYAGDSHISFVKRISGIPGSVVRYQNKEQILESDSYFVEGDNRSFSTDSRTFGPINLQQIIGKVIGF